MRRTTALALATTLAATAGLAAAPAGPAAGAGTAYSVTTVYFQVEVGPEDDRQTCDVVGDLYEPDTASAQERVPAVLTTNGFGGSKDDQAGLARLFASDGYVVLSYSGLGFGGSGCEITLDDPAYDGQAAARLIDFLGGEGGIAFEDADHTRAAPTLDTVLLDEPGDPRVGMVGGSYGGQVQYAAASVTAKLDTIVPLITWNDLSYSLAPNNTDQLALPGQEQEGVSTRTSGSVKTNWALGFSALGLTGDVANQRPDPISSACPNFASFVCPALVLGATTGTLDPASVAQLRRASVASYQDRVRVPTLILQGQADTLFNLNEAVATYQALKAQGTPVKMSWTEYGHSGAPAEGEIDFDAPDPATQHVTKRIHDWFEHHLKGRTEVSTGPEFSYFRDWVDYAGNATPAYQGAASYPVGTTSTYHLSSSPRAPLTGGALVTDRADVRAGSERFTVPAGPASNGEDLDVIGSAFEQPEAVEPVREAPGTFARYDTDPLTAPVDVVGSPQVRLQVEAPSVTATQGQDAGRLVLYLKVVDVAPDGSASVVRNLAAPVRLPDVTRPATVTMPAFVHRFEKGHRVRLLVAGASPNYRGNNAPAAVSIETTGDTQTGDPLPLQSLTLPTLRAAAPSGADTAPPPTEGDGPGAPGAGEGDAAGAGEAAPAVVVAGAVETPVGTAATATTTAATTALPDTGGPSAALLAAGLLLTLLGAAQVRRGRRPTAQVATTSA
ncbi:CocE/NonD family hydrolase [Nocardioides aequoreus]|uniref:CocE/NonD family hydrolase n=1 Tax=Nocardioides aequoreus TaxID=397278 RepID=UPI000A06EAAE|nr:CocE/NonD family hydrolase [Nocardioides aequoreus]